MAVTISLYRANRPSSESDRRGIAKNIMEANTVKAIIKGDNNTVLNANDETLAILNSVNADELTAASSDVFLIA